MINVPSECDKPISETSNIKFEVSEISSDSVNQVCKCERAKGLFLINCKSHEVKKLNCKAYCCDYCGKYKVMKFRKALSNYVKHWDFIRLFTFTQHTPSSLNVEYQQKNISKVWALFVKEIRRCPQLSNRQKSFQYVKIVEFTKRHYVHFHVVIDTFLPILILRRLWNESLFKVFGVTGGRGGINVTVSQNHKSCVSYLTKYLSKMSRETFRNLRRWTKSGKVALFEVYQSPDKWIFFSLSEFGKLNLKNISTTTQIGAMKFDVLHHLAPEVERIKISILNYILNL